MVSIAIVDNGKEIHIDGAEASLTSASRLALKLWQEVHAEPRAINGATVGFVKDISDALARP